MWDATMAQNLVGYSEQQWVHWSAHPMEVQLVRLWASLWAGKKAEQRAGHSELLMDNLKAHYSVLRSAHHSAPHSVLHWDNRLESLSE